MKTAVVLLCLAVAIAYAYDKWVDNPNIVKENILCYYIQFNFFTENNAQKANAQLVNTSSATTAQPNSIVLVNVDFAPFAPITQPSRIAISIVRMALPNVQTLATGEKSSVWTAARHAGFKLIVKNSLLCICHLDT